MGRGTCTFKRRDVTAAVKAVVAAGVTVARVEIDRDGRIAVFANLARVKAVDGGENEWDLA
jgi:hypothetical protein